MTIPVLTTQDTFAQWFARTNEIIAIINGNSLDGTSVPGTANAFIKSDANGKLASGWLEFDYLKLTGGTLTGTIVYDGSVGTVLRLKTKDFIKLSNELNPIIQNDDRIFITAGGTYGTLDIGNLPLKSLYLTADTDARIIANLKPGNLLGAKQYIFGGNGNAIFPGNITSATGTLTVNAITTSNLLITNNFSASGNFSVGSLSVATTVDIGGAVNVAGNVSATSFTETSDFRLKEKIIPLRNALAIINDINGVKYNLIGSTRREIGVVAQEVERVMPELVEVGPDGMRSVNYSRITALLLEAVKELQQEVAALKKQQ